MKFVRSFAVAAVVLAASLAFAQTESPPDPPRPPRTYHGSLGGGGSFVLTGAGGDRNRFDVAFDLKPKSRYGFVAAWRAFDDKHEGLVMAGIVYEGAAARPRLVLDLHADAGWDLDARRPLVGAGIRSTLTIIGPLGVSFDSGAYFVIGGIDHSRLHIQSNALIVARW